MTRIALQAMLALVISIDVSIQNARGLLEFANFPIRQEDLHSLELRVPPAMPGLIPFIPL